MRCPRSSQLILQRLTGQPNRAANGIRQSATRNWIGPKDIGAKTITRTAYRLENTIAKLISFVFILYFYLPIPRILLRNGWEAPPTRNPRNYRNLLKTFTTNHQYFMMANGRLMECSLIQVY